MKRKELLNKQAIKAISIGLSATIALTPVLSIPVHAEEADPNQSNTSEAKVPETTQAEATVKAQKAAEISAQEAVDASATKVIVVPTSPEPSFAANNKQVPVDTATKQAADDAQSYIDNKTLSSEDEVIKAALDLDDTSATDELKKGSVDGESNPISTVQDELETTREAATEIDNASKEIANQTKTANDIASNTNQTLQKAEDDFDNEVKAISNATNGKDANVAYNNAIGIADDALIKYGEAEKKFNSVLEEIKNEDKKILEAQQKYDEALNNATGDADQAAEELEVLKKSTEVLQTKANEAAEKMAEAAAYKIITNQEKCDDGKLVWEEQDALFESIIKNYYVPQVLGTQEGTSISIAVKKRSYNSNIPETKDGNANYIEVKYIDSDNKEQTKYYNYKLDQGTRRLIIFEKEESTITLEKEVPAHFEFSVEEDGKVVTKSVTEAEVNNNTTATGALADGTAWGENETVQYVSDTKDGSTSYLKKDDQKSVEQIIEEKNDEVNEDGSKTTVIIDDEDAALSVDEFGNIVKTITGDVTTITKREGVSLEGGSGYTSEQAANTALQNELTALGNLVESGSVNSNISEETTYSATAIYIPKFTITIDMSGITAKKNKSNRFYNNTKSVAKEIGNTALVDIEKLLEAVGYRVLDKTNSVVAENDDANDVDNRGIFNDFDAYKTTLKSTISVTFAKLEKKSVEVDLSTWDIINPINWFSNDDNKDKAEAEAKKKIEIEKGFVAEDLKWLNCDWDTAEASYYQGTLTTATAGEYATKEAAESAALAQINSEIEKNAAFNEAKTAAQNAAKNAVNKDLKSIAASIYEDCSRIQSTTKNVEYGYSGTYTEKTETVEEDQTIARTTWNATTLEYVNTKDAVTKSGPYSNAYYDNFIKSGRKTTTGILLVEKDDIAYNAFLDLAKAQKDAYETLAMDAENALKSVKNAKEKVDVLKGKLAALKVESNKSSTLLMAEKAELSVQLKEAQGELEQAEKIKDDINKKKEDAKKKLDDKIESLRKTQEIGGDTGGATDGGNTLLASRVKTKLIEDEILTPGAPAVVNLVDGAGNGDNVGNVDAFDQGGIVDEVVEIEETLVPGDDAPDEAEVEIEENQTPKAATPDLLHEDEKSMSLWWLLIIALLGATGYQMYRKYQQKK